MHNRDTSKLFKHSQQLLFNPLASSVLSTEAFQSVSGTCLAESPNKQVFRDTLEKLLKQSRFRSLLNAYQDAHDKFPNLPIFRNGFSLDKSASFLNITLCRESNSINSFVKARDEFEEAIIKTDYVLAESVLDLLAKTHGKSLWIIRSRIILLSYQERTPEIRQYCSSMMQGPENDLFNTLISYFQLFSDSDPNDCLQLHDSIISKHVVEFSQANYHEMAGLLSIFFSPTARSDLKNLVACLPLVQIFPLVDQYVIFAKILQRLVVEEICTGEKFELDARPILNNISKSIIDPQLSRTSKFLNGSIESEASEFGKDLLYYYESGNYQEAIDLFENSLANIVNPLSYVNLIAKAHAYIGLLKSKNNKGIVFNLIDLLIPLFTLESSPRGIEENIWSRVIRLRGLNQCENIQTALFLALPHRYGGLDIKRASAFTVIVSSEFTPLIANILVGPAGLFGTRYSCPTSVVTPNYRSIKNSICHAINTGASLEEVDTLFHEFKNTSPLLKDYLELYSEYCIFSSQFHRLLQVSAESLVINPDTYACIPMGYLAKEIETKFCADLNAVIVAFYYSKNVSQSINGLLNELFEEYVLTYQAEKPSELLVNLKSLTNLELIFFRDVCIPDVMDCLACFSNISELRAERILILDLLFQLGVIDNDTRAREADELVGMSIIDFAASGISSHKITIDVDSLRKNLSKESSSLFNSYKSLPEHEEERVTLWRENPDPNEADNAYMTGPKNSLILKLCNLHREAFLFDDKHGLDKILSTEIRHGFFSNLMRSILQERVLITNIADDGKYSANQYWREKNLMVNIDVWKRIDNKLKEFSAGFNKLILDTEEWMKIRVTVDQTNRVFAYNLLLHDFKDVQSKLIASDSSDDVSQYIFDLLLRQTEGFLTEIRQRLHSEFQIKLDALFKKLIDDITIEKRSVALVELMSTILQTQSDIKELVTTVSEWFKISPHLELGQLQFDRVVEISTTIFKNINGATLDITLELNPYLKDVNVPGPSVKPLTIALINLIDNCYRRSGLSSKVKISLVGNATDNGAILSISNNLSFDNIQLLTNSLFRETNRRLISPKSSILMRTESGSGLVKAANQISSASEKSTLNVELIDSTFTAIVNYVS
jgi:tetratricopeptide (TPR) repeat protein